jgi:uncharacterized protein YyaL (SSP411 family)
MAMVNAGPRRRYHGRMPNRLASESSLYLRQHAGNPVDWWPWGPAALDHARDAGKPILLSIGYSACHWCHVMAHECFEDAATAAAMNALFVNIKVDREERPDLDRIYQSAHQALTGRGGGWPLTVFLDPGDLLPFFAGTYFPREARHGLPAFADLLRQVRGWYDAHPEDRREQNNRLGDWLCAQSATPGAGLPAGADPLHEALAAWREDFDAEYGGHRGAPKFPHCGELQAWLDDAADMAERTLQGMADGGLQDLLGGGFFRYSVDARWEIPHFEKMLYDNAQLLPLYARAARQFDRPEFARVALDIAAWLQRDMALADGGYASALDADSEGEEGRYYLWTPVEVEALLPPDIQAVAVRRFGLDGPANVDHRAWHLRRAASVETIAAALGRAPDTVAAQLEQARTMLLTVRNRRVPPARDDKLSTASNALLLAGLARTARLLGNDALLAQAETVRDALHCHVWRDGRLYAVAHAGVSTVPGFLDDHAFLLDALLDLLGCRWRDADLHWAIALAEQLLLRFADDAGGGFLFTPHDHEPLPQRPKSFVDESQPSGNAVAARALLLLGHLLGETRYLDAAEATVRAGADALQRYPQACASLLGAWGQWSRPTPQIVVRCTLAMLPAWHEALQTTAPETVDAWLIPADAGPLPGLLAERTLRGDGVAYLCEGLACRAPIASPAALHETLQALTPR